MTSIPFYKMSGCGNDFIIVDNRDNRVDLADNADFIPKVCRRAMSVGADGFILIEDSADADFRWRFYNADGSVAEMCGNGARCVARFAFLNGIAGSEMRFETDAGVVSASVQESLVKLKMTDPVDLKTDWSLPMSTGLLQLSSVNTGVPHVVATVDDIDGVDVVSLGREIRYHDAFAPAGTNANFVSMLSDNMLAIRTYERGVEGETLACGTGAVAGAIVTAVTRNLPSPIALKTRSGGYLTIHFKHEAGRFSHVYLEGDARLIYTGDLSEDAWNY